MGWFKKLFPPAEPVQSVLDVNDFRRLLHPVVVKASYQLFESKLYRDAILNGITATFDLLRDEAESELDGVKLAQHAYSLAKPRLAVGDLQTESGRSDQQGMIQMLGGLYMGFRNPSAHTLQLSPSRELAAQVLITSSMLVWRIQQSATMFIKCHGFYIARTPVNGFTDVLRFYDEEIVIGARMEKADALNASHLELSHIERMKGYHSGLVSLVGNRLEFEINGIQYSGRGPGKTLWLRSEGPKHAAFEDNYDYVRGLIEEGFFHPKYQRTMPVFRGDAEKPPPSDQ